jgi:hypothetical protein
MFEISQGKYIVASRIVDCNIYEKDQKFGIAISMDTVNAEARTAYSAKMATREEAVSFINKMNDHL